MMHNVKIYAASKPVNPEVYDLTRFASLFDQMRDRKRIKATMLSMAASDQPGNREWFVVETKHKQEISVEHALSKAGVKTFFAAGECRSTGCSWQADARCDAPADAWVCARQHGVFGGCGMWH